MTGHIEYDNTINIMKTKFSISMDNDLLQEIDSLAKTENRTRSNLIERLIKDRLAPQEMLSTAAEIEKMIIPPKQNSDTPPEMRIPKGMKI